MKKTYQMEEVDCVHCASKMEMAIAALDGVVSASINFFAQKLTVEFADGADEKKIMKLAQKACKKVDSNASILL